MRKAILFMLLLFGGTMYAQSGMFGFPADNTGEFTGGFGLTWIDDEPHYAVRLTPDISFDKWGVGLDLNLEFDSQGNLREENFNDFSDYLAIIRYIRYGRKYDDVFVKAGAIDNYTLGYGNIMFGYSNSPGMDDRKTGLAVDLNFGKFGFESIYSDFSQAGLLGFRGYALPLQFTSAKDIPILSNFEIGATVVSDFHKHAGIPFGMVMNQQPLNQITEEMLPDGEATTVVGVDIGLPLFKTGILTTILYSSYSKILDYGGGAATGLLFNFDGMGIVSAYAKFERRFNEAEYVPSYFNALYEIDRYSVDGAMFWSKAAQLQGFQADNGFFGGLGIDVLGMLTIEGSYQRLDKTPNSGILRLSSDVTPEDAPVVVRIGYDKVNIENDTDMFTLDNRSRAYAEAGYKPMEYILVSLYYQWTFTPVRDADDAIIGYEPQKRLEPRVTFVYPFNVGG